MAKRDDRGSRAGGPGRWFYLLLAAVAAGGVAFLLLAGRGGDGEGPERPLPAWATEVEADSAAGVPLGPEDAPVTIAEFADYQCPHCAQFGAFTGRLIRQNYVEGERLVRWVLYDYLVGFPNSLPSALAARCADAQGRFWEMHDLLLARQARWGPSESAARLFRDYARELGLDDGRFGACMEERRPLEQVLAAHKYGEQLGVRGTPTLFLNGRMLDNRTEVSYDALERLIRAAADSTRAAGADAASG